MREWLSKETFGTYPSQIQKMHSQIHRATNSAPKVDRVIKEMQRTLFTDSITNIPIPNIKLKIPHMAETWITELTCMFLHRNGRTRFEDRERDTCFCQIFVENLAWTALKYIRTTKCLMIRVTLSWRTFTSQTVHYEKHSSPSFKYGNGRSK